MCSRGVYVNSANGPVNPFPSLSTVQAEIAAGRYNPLSAQPASAEELARFVTDQSQQSHSVRSDAVVKLNGSLLAIPGGWVRAAFGGEWLYENKALTWNIQRKRTRLSRRVGAGFAEVYVPLVGPDNIWGLYPEHIPIREAGSPPRRIDPVATD